MPHAGLVYSGVVAAAAWRLVGPAAGPSAGGPRRGRRRSARSGRRRRRRSSSSAPTTARGGSTASASGTAARGGRPLGDLVSGGVPHAGGAGARSAVRRRRPLPPGRALAGGPAAVPRAARAGGADRRPLGGDGRRSAGDRGRRAPGSAPRRAPRTAGERVVLAISTDMAHYPAAHVAERVTATLLPLDRGPRPGGPRRRGGRLSRRRARRLVRHVRDRAGGARPRGAAGDGRPRRGARWPRRRPPTSAATRAARSATWRWRSRPPEARSVEARIRRRRDRAGARDLASMARPEGPEAPLRQCFFGTSYRSARGSCCAPFPAWPATGFGFIRYSAKSAKGPKMAVRTAHTAARRPRFGAVW